MSYLGLSKHMTRGVLSRIRNPSVLEIGTDKGQTTVPNLHNMAFQHGPSGENDGFTYYGVDIKVRKHLIEQVFQMEAVWTPYLGAPKPSEDDMCQVRFYEENSLSWIPKADSLEFDLVWLDGDHNYYTIKSELNLLEKHCLKPTSVIVCDDFNGRYAEKDMFYSEKEEYINNDKATPRVESSGAGVQQAVRDFAEESNNLWSVWSIPDVEPCILWRPDRVDLKWIKPSVSAPYALWTLSMSVI